jgi:hypothetical protein
MSGRQWAEERITHVDTHAPAQLDDFIDEIVLRGANVHVEMMTDRAAFMDLGGHVFWINCVKGKLKIHYSERRDVAALPETASHPGRAGG